MGYCLPKILGRSSQSDLKSNKPIIMEPIYFLVFDNTIS